MTNILYKGLIGKEDVYWDESGQAVTYNRRASLGTVTMTKIFDPRKAIRTVEYYGAKDDSGITDNTAAIQAALAAGGEIRVTAPNGGFYKITDTLTASKAARIISKNKAEIRQATAGKGGITATASGVEIDGLKLTGPQHAAYAAGERGIYIYGTVASYVTRPKIRNCEISNWGNAGIVGIFISDFDYLLNDVYDCYFNGITANCALDGMIHKNRVHDIEGAVSGNAYGIIISRTDASTLAASPRSERIIVSENLVDNVTQWEGLDTHSGKNITFSKNVVTNCYIGLSAGRSEDENGDDMFAPLNVNILGNTIDSGKTDGTASFGIVVTGAYEAPTVNEYATGSIIGNTVKGHGYQATATNGAIVYYNTRGLKVENNNIQEPSPTGINAYYNNEGFSVTGNTVLDAWSTDGTGKAIYADAGGNKGFIGGNSLLKGTKSATSVMLIGIQIDSNATDDIVLGDNYSEADYPYSGAFTYASFGSRDGGNFILRDVFTYTDFSAAAAAATHNFYTGLPPGTVVTDVWWKLDTEFSGGGVASATLHFGVVSGDVDGFFPAENVFTGATAGYKDSAISSRGELLYDATAGNTMPLHHFIETAETFRATVTVDGGHLTNQLTAGQATIWIKGYRVK